MRLMPGSMTLTASDSEAARATSPDSASTSAADAMRCGNGSERTQHPVELFGLEWAKACGADVGEPEAAGPAPATG